MAGTIVPAGIAAVLFVIVGLLALIPGDLERRMARLEERRRSARIAKRLATVPATIATGVRTAIDNLRHPREGARAIGGALGYWVGMVGIMWASFHAFGGGRALRRASCRASS